MAGLRIWPQKTKLSLAVCTFGGLFGVYLFLQRKRTVYEIFQCFIRRYAVLSSETDKDKELLTPHGRPLIEDEQLRRLRRTQFEVLVVNSEDEWNKAYDLLKDDLNSIKTLGLDCEWVTRDKKSIQPVALLQIATQQGTCVLFRLCKFKGKTIPETLKTLLADQSVKKFGVAICEDAAKLLSHYGLQVLGCVDLRNIVGRVKPYEHLSGSSLKRLYEGVCGKTLDKSTANRCSDWESDVLSPSQVEYAAYDAISAVDILTELILYRMCTKSPGQDLIDDFQTRASSLTQGLVDLRHNSSMKNPSSSKVRSAQKNGNGELRSDSTADPTRSYSLRKKPLYHNCQLLAPDGQLLCTCDKKKAEWYIEKGIGEKVLDEPLTVRLKFEPAGRPESKENYYLQEKDNICVVCGAPDSYVRKSIIPHEYRKHFPMLLKNHRSHDILLLCVLCHQRSGVYDGVLRQRLAAICDAPIGSEEDVRFHQDPDLMKVRSSAKALLKSGDKIPAERKGALENTVKSYYGVDSLDNNLLREAVGMDIKVASDKFSPHGLKVVQHMLENGGLVQFEKTWRQNFVSTMQPQFLPHKWSIDHNHTELEDIESELKLRLGES